jgi:hypothetical protein
MPTKVNIKKITGLPLNFSGSAGKVKFRIIRQMDIYNNVNAVLEDANNGDYILSVDGTQNADALARNFTNYVHRYDQNIFPADVQKRMKPFFIQLNKDVKEENKSTPKKKAAVKKKAAPKKAAPKKKAPKKAAKKVKLYQYGNTNIKRDKKIQAKKPGKRTSSSGKTYYEYRANRSDAGKLLGTKTHKDTKSHNVNIRVVSGAENYNDPIYILNEINYWQKQLDKSRAEYKSPQRKMYKSSIMQDIRLSKKWLDNNKLKLKKILSKIK